MLKNFERISLFVILLICVSSSYTLSQELSIYDEGIKILQEYISIDTTNPPGNEMKTAVFLKKILDREGIENQIFDLGNNRANLLAILRGDGSKKPVILLHHMDVVPADPEYWTVPPFSGKIIDGKIYGRGAVDMKAKGIIDLMTIINLKRMNVPLKRDIMLLAVSDEEVASLGSRWMVEKKSDLIKEAEFLLDEGGYVVTDNKENILYYMVTIGEKAPLWLNLTFTGTPGHGSIPIEDSSVNRAIRAANRLIDYKPEFIIIPELKEYIKLLLANRDITKIPGYTGDFDTSLTSKTFLDEISRVPAINACLRNTISITCLKGSEKINTIPNEASISIDCRLLPGVDRDKFIEKLKEVILDDSVTIKIEDYASATSSPWNNEFSEALKKCILKRGKDVPLVPLILLSSTDSTFYRPLGIITYGFESCKYSSEECDTAHGNDERIGVDTVRFGIDLLTDILKEL
jgi:acetylornithine deacetylase/succinyl-diaminopimelate desuccinylase-like protein